MTEKYRRPKKTQDKIDEIKRENNPKKAIEGIVDLFENYTNFEEQVPVRYDPQTGKAVEFEWRTSTYPGTSFPGKFLPEIYLGGVNLIDPTPIDPGLAENIVALIKKSPISIDTCFGTYIFNYEERDASGTEQGGGTYYATRHQISVKQVHRLV